MLSTLAAASCLSIIALNGPVEGDHPNDQIQAPEVVAPPTFPEHFEQVSLDSGPRAGVPGADAMQLIFSEQIGAKDAPYIRLVFGELDLPGEPGTSQSAYLAITSLQDGAVQYLDADAASQWRGMSAYFNGSTVLVELFVSPETEPGRVVVAGVVAGEWVSGQRSTCGAVDDRMLSSDPRVGRIAPLGCTAWLFNGRSNCLLTAGHCGPNSSQVVWFNVPLSTSGGIPVAPPPEDQYVVDAISVQSTGNAGIGADWSTFGVFDNANTGLSPFAAQGSSFQLAASAPPVDGQTIRVTGFGSTAAPVDPTWDSAQKTHSGPYVAGTSTTLTYQVDTSGGNSGGPVIDESTGMAIGIHTHGGCNTSGGNRGTVISLPALQGALNDPQGVCVPPSLTFNYPFGRPEVVSPDGGDTVRVVIGADSGIALQPNTVRLHVNDGSGEQVMLMAEIDPATYEGTFPPLDCGTVGFFVTAQDTEGTVYFDPRAAPGDPYTSHVAHKIVFAADDNFESETGWTVENGVGLVTGAWQRGVPVAGSTGAPTSDYDLSGQCWLTHNSVTDSDVDGGPTTLISPIFDLSSMTDPVVGYARWLTNNSGDADALVVEVSDDDGASWVLLESITGSDPFWREHQNMLPAGVAPTGQFRVRFTIADQPNNSVLEAAIDQFQIFDSTCDFGCNDADFAEPFGVLDFDDVLGFLMAFGSADPDADLALELGEFDFNDVIAFLTAFGAGCP